MLAFHLPTTVLFTLKLVKISNKYTDIPRHRHYFSYIKNIKVDQELTKSLFEYNIYFIPKNC